MQIDLKRRELIALIGGAAVCPLAAHSQESDRMRLIGVLMGSVENDPVSQSLLAAFRGALAKLGWTEASNLRIKVRWCADAVLCARYAADLVALGPKVLLAVSTPSLAALRQQTRTIPIVFGGVADPVGRGLSNKIRRFIFFSHVKRGSSMKSGTPSVRSTICSAISLGSALPPPTWVIISARCRFDRRLRLRIVTCERPIQGGVNSGRKVMISKTRRVGIRSISRSSDSRVVGSLQWTSSNTISTG